MSLRIPSVVLAALFTLSVATAADEKAVETQKAAATANLNKAGIKKLVTAETADLLVVSSLPEAKTKTLADAAQKVFVTARAALKLDPKEALWPGKLTVVAVGDSREYSAYIRAVTQQRPQSQDWFAINVRGDTPTASILVEGADKPKDPEAVATFSTIVAAALLNKKAGTGPMNGSLPEWMQLGFGKLMVAKSAGGAAMTDYRTKTKALVVGTKSKPSQLRLTSVWGGEKSKDSDLVAASLVEYMMYGIEGDKFFSFATAFKPAENRDNPTVESALEVVEWKADALELGWKVWVSKQK